MRKDPETRALYRLIQTEFEHLDKQLGSFQKRNMLITRMPELARDLYLIHDALSAASSGGIAAWLAHHDEEPGWSQSTIEAFTRVGYPQIAQDLEKLLPLCRSKREFTWRDGEAETNFIIDHEDEILRALRAYLLANDYVFQP